MNTVWQDLRYGVRVLLKNPGFALVAVLTLALGIAVNTAIFSIVNAVLLRPLPYNQPERITMVYSTNEKRGITTNPHSFPNFADYHAEQQSFEALAAYTGATAALSGGELPEQINGVAASPDIFKVLAAAPLKGRTFEPEDEREGGAPVVVISYGMWQRRFGSDPNIVGRQIMLDGESQTIIGVMPRNFQFLFVNDPPEFWVPLDPASQLNKQRGAIYLSVIGRLKPNVTIQQAGAELRTIAGRLSEQYKSDNANRSVQLVPALEDMTSSLRPTLLVLLGAVGFVLLIACANVANLLLARAAGRGREIAIRVAHGASRWRIIRQLLTESILLALIGGGLGLLIAVWGVESLASIVPADIPRFDQTSVDFRVLGFTLLASALTGVIFGLAPALQASRLDLNEALKEGGRSATGGRARNRMRSFLIISEVALSLVLLVGAGLLVKSFMQLRNVNPGFNPQNALTASVSLPSIKYKEDEQALSFFHRTIERVSQLQGVEAVGAVMPLPLSQNSMSISFTVDGRPEPAPGEKQSSGARITTPGYFRAMGIPLIKGRVFTDADRPDSPQVVLINETLARRFFPGEDPIGKRLKISMNSINGEIVGVVGDVRHSSLDTEAGPEFYVPFTQVPQGDMALVVRTSGGDPAALAPSLRQAVKEIDSDQPLYEVRTMNSLVSSSIARQRFSMALVALFAVLALVLASVGIFSVMSFLVTQRTHEIGIRMALGAQASDVLKMILKQGMLFTLIGLGIGLIAALALTRVMGGLLFNVRATDPLTFAGVSLLLMLVAFIACYIPARRATRVDPMRALHYE
ncbi:MAG TPA: ABC transporter permease [Pyrinomonadaceae bacterium]|jgi:putative ABC transport system permease protein